jgi:phage terminase large subunit-like protein
MPMTAAPPRRSVARPFTVAHFRSWARKLTLDNGKPWVVDPYFEAFLVDYFAGIPECWLIVPEENAKTTNLAGLALYVLEFRSDAMSPWAASSREQAEIGYKQAEGFVRRSPRLGELFQCLPGYRKIRHRETGAEIKIFAADEGTGDGVIFTDAFIDELHRHKSLALYRTWSGKLGKRQGQLATISTAGEVGSEFETTREKIRQGLPTISRRPGYIHVRSDQVTLHEYAIPEDGDPTDMAVVKLANPFSGITVKTLDRKFNKPTMTLNHWRRFTCNYPTRDESAAIQEAEWHAAATTDEIPAGETIWLGLDVAFKWDTTAAVPFWMPAPPNRVLGPATILTPPRDGSSLEVDAIKRAIVVIHQRNPIAVVVMDTSHAEDLAQWIRDNITQTVVDRQQTNTLAVEDYERFMSALRNGWLQHAGDPGLTRHALNAVARVLPFGDARFDRVSQTRQGGNQEIRVIDALTAAAMVNSVASAQPEPVAEPIVAWG